MWNSVLAGVVFEHDSKESLRRELSRNAQLRYMCGFRGGNKTVPESYVYSRFFKNLFKDETPWSKIVKWFGYRLHLIVDSNYEFPVAFKVMKASDSEVKQAHKMIDELNRIHPEITKKCEILSADKGYDDIKFHEKLWNGYRIKPVIDIRNMWKDLDKTRTFGNYENVIYDYKGTVYCVCMETGKQRETCAGGFEKDRKKCGTLKKLCLAKQLS